MDRQEQEGVLHKKVMDAVFEYYKNRHGSEESFKSGDRIHYAGRVFDEEEILNLVDASLEFWLTAGRYTEQMEKDLTRFLDVKYCSLVNSGSSANLIAFMALTSQELGKRRIKPGDEVITVAAGFPTTIAPIVQYGAIPVFVDIKIPSYNIDCSQLEEALSPKTKAIMLAHTLGNPFDLKQVKEFCDRHSLWLVEDNCDALGSRYYMDERWNYTGTTGDIGTSSFYPPHHITTGEGGAVYTNNPILHRIMQSLRDWGRDCWCASGKDNSCGCRFNKRFGELPLGYDHKYVYSHFGYNLKPTDLQAAIGCAQIKKLPRFIDTRKENWLYLKNGLASLDNVLILPQEEKNSDPSWFGFVITVREESPFTRNDLVKHLEENNIQTRMLFAGNIIKHPCFDEMRELKQGYRVVNELKNTDVVVNRTFWIGVYPGLSIEMLDFVIQQIKGFCERYD